MSENVKKWIPGIIIAVVAIYALMKLSGNSGGSQVYNALIPSGGAAPPDSRDPARVQAFSTLGSVGLAQMSLAQKSEELAATVGLARDRFGYQIDALNIQNQGMLERLRAELADRQYDRDLQARAIDQSFALAQSGQFGQQAGSILGALLNALGRGQQQGSRPSGGSSGGSSGGVPSQQRRTVPQMSRAAYERLRQSALLQAIFGAADPTGSGPIGINPDSWPGFDSPGAFGPYADYSGLQDTLDWWRDLTEPIGSVTSSYDLLDPWYAPSFDRSVPVYNLTDQEYFDFYFPDSYYE